MVMAAFLMGMFVFLDFVKVQAIDFEAWEKLSPEKRAELTATSRAMTYYLSGSVVADTDEENGNSYNWRKQGTISINGELQKFTDGSFSVDRCIESSNPDDLEKELVEHSYEYNASWGGEVKRFQAQCSTFQRGTTCKAGACVPISPPPEDKVDIKTTGCVDWLFGCVCGEGYEPDYNDATNEYFCTRRVESTFAYNDTSSKWEEVVTTINWRGTDYKRKPAWIYFDEAKEVFEKAAAAYRAGPETKTKEKPARPEEPNDCVRNLVSSYSSLFESCFRSTGPAQRFDDYTSCVEKNANSNYRKEAEACGAELLGSSYNASVSDQPPAASTSQRDAEADLLEKFKQALVDLRPAPEDFADDDEQDEKAGLREGSDEQWYFGLPYGPYVSNAQSDYTFSYRITFTRKDEDGNPEVVLPDGKKLDYTYVSLANDRSIPPGTKIITPPGVEVRLKFFMDQIRKPTVFGYDPYADNTYTRTVSVDIGENSELTVEEVYNGFVKMVVNEGYARFRKRKPVPLGPASPAGVMLGTKGTDFGIAYDPATRQTVAEIYDGTIEIIDLDGERVLETLSALYGGEILAAEIAEDKTIVEKIAIPQSEWDGFVKSQVEGAVQRGEGKKGASLWWVLLLAVVLGGGYVLYRKGLLFKLASILHKNS